MGAGVDRIRFGTFVAESRVKIGGTFVGAGAG
jgi:hypothetical protein